MSGLGAAGAAAAAPMQLRAQQPEVVVARRVQQRDAICGRLDDEPRTRLEIAEQHAVAGDLRPRGGPRDQTHFQAAVPADHDRPVGQRVRRDRRDDNRAELRMDDRAAA